jgi:SAM-dependent methyltransferase
MRDDAGTEVPCALCGARDTRRLYTKWKWGIERCRRCGLVYANPRAPEDAILARYSAEYFWNEYLPQAGAPGGVVDYEVVDARNAEMLALIRRLAPAANRLLEVGSGAGLFLKAAERAGWDVAGLELSHEGAAFARDRLSLDVRTEAAEAMSFEPESFDVAVMFDVIEHLFDPRAVLAATRRVLKPGGLVVVSTPNFDALSRRALGVDWTTLSPLEHVYYFTESTLARMLVACGFRNVRFERMRIRMPVEFMNYRSTHAPEKWRAKIYEWLVTHDGERLGEWAQTRGRGDALLGVAIV